MVGAITPGLESELWFSQPASTGSRLFLHLAPEINWTRLLRRPGFPPGQSSEAGKPDCPGVQGGISIQFFDSL
jgi:hypothetical protein